MKNEYQKPEAEIISLLALEKITTEEYSDDIIDGTLGIESNPFD